MTQATRSKFIQVPNVFLDTCELPETFQIGYLRLLRHYGRTKVFTGSIRKLSNVIRIPKSTVARMIPAWVSEGLVNKREENGVLTLEILIDDLWERNEKCPKLGQVDDEVESVTVPKRDKSVPNWDESVPKRDKSVPLVSTNYPPYTSNTNNTKKDISASQNEDAARSSFSQTLVSHPEHNFIWFDDLMTPSRMVVRLTPAFPSHYYSEQEDKHRERIAGWEIQPYLESKGLKVSIQWEHETEQEIEQALAENENKDEPTAKTSEVHRLTKHATPSSPVQVKRDESPREIEAETQEQMPTLPVINTRNNPSNDVEKQDDANIPIAPEAQGTEEAKRKRPSRAKKQKPIEDLSPEEQARIAEEQEKEAARAERHRSVLTRIIARRGFALEDRQDIINEHKFINKLMDKYTDAQIDRIHRYLVEEDWKYSKVDNKYAVGAYIIWKESAKVAQILKERREQETLKDQREGVHRKTIVETSALSKYQDLDNYTPRRRKAQ